MRWYQPGTNRQSSLPTQRPFGATTSSLGAIPLLAVAMHAAVAVAALT